MWPRPDIPPYGTGPNFPRRPETTDSGDAALIVPRLQSAVARVLPAIEATLTKLAAAPAHPRELEQSARALGALTRTLRELNGLLGQHRDAAAPVDDDPPPEDMDEFRNDLARRINAFVAGREAERSARYEAAWHDDAAEAEAAEQTR